MSPAEPLSRGVLLRVFLRSLFLQASWNPKGMQNLGLAYSLFPALERLYPEKADQEAAVRRHLVFFNTHPYVAAAILGGVLYHEQRIARGEEPPDKVVAFKAALMGPLAALGDGFFWLSLKPAVGAVCAASVPVLHAWAALLFLFLYNLVHLTLRARLFFMGLVLGDRLVEAVARANLPTRGARLRSVAAASAGGLAAWLAVDLGRTAGGNHAPWLVAGCLALGVVSYILVQQRVPNYVVLYLAAGLACAAGAFL
ncbi:PTS system mannose/fructose/sorbose family transporter subunit IID [Hyalangium rubrum]|uniref:PTS system mannose/fructose/sorbose family transporter subunit IID n=1 Tax=Hyalangium rubrum TaxID=3103134 RepID=A0ABU5H2N0_9BACT|nr:PTS system mannose/fructose/sorbose family transporter subunit IID [Hyalangium sp. s54d21]MDY7227536.1 PTS system mannose/fructose/sorbose family transporter subunit IID [Hyalangium sp. s54d21]